MLLPFAGGRHQDLLSIASVLSLWSFLEAGRHSPGVPYGREEGWKGPKWEQKLRKSPTN